METLHASVFYLCMIAAAGNITAGSWHCFAEANQMYLYTL